MKEAPVNLLTWPGGSDMRKHHILRKQAADHPSSPTVPALERRPMLRLAGSELEEALPQASQAPSEPSARPRERRVYQGFLVEFVRLIILSLFALGGWEIAAATTHDGHLMGVILGSAVGYVVGGMFGRRTATAVSDLERELARIPAADILAGGTGLLAGIVMATLLSLPLFHLPVVAAGPTVAFVFMVCGYAGYKIGRAKSEDLFAVFGVKPRAAGHQPADVAVLDSSAVLDGRIKALIEMGFMSGTLLLTKSVLEEIQAVADSSNAGRRARGRRALELLIALKRDPSVDVVLIQDEGGGAGEQTDARLVRLARSRGAILVTNDSGLARVAAALDVPVRSIHALADALRPPVFAGERVSIRLARRGRESGQAIGYLADGTMVVVEEADHLLGETVEVAVTNAIQTSTGQLVFARLGDDVSEDDAPRG
jgi:uncharacterized protein YacL